MGKIVCIGGLNGLKNEKGEFISYKPRKIDKEIMKCFSWNECRKLLLV